MTRGSDLIHAAGPQTAAEVWPVTAASIRGVLHIGGVPLPELAEACGTPLYVLDEADFRQRARQWREESGADQVHYASKALLCTEIVRWVDSERLHLDVCSGDELEVALDAGFDPGRIVMHGNNKSVDELRLGVARRVGVIVVDCYEELERIAYLAGAEEPQQVYLRVATGIEADTHRSIATGGDDVKFGFPLTGGHAERAAAQAAQTPGVRLLGIHSHLGSQLLTSAGFRAAARRVGELVHTLAEHHRIEIRDVDLGGGAGIAYLPGQERLSPVQMVSALRSGLEEVTAAHSIRLAVEPGRSMIGTAGVTLYRVGVVKDGIRRRFVAVDGGMSDAPRPALYGSLYTAWIANRDVDPAATPTVIVGRHCETGDIVVPDLSFPADVEVGDLVAVPGTGAYHHSMASNYNFQPRPPVVAVRDGRARLLVRRETHADLVVRDCGTVPVPLPEKASRTGRGTEHPEAAS